jgi:predicted signal transduction protein with EAL and GGDEF domain
VILSRYNHRTELKALADAIIHALSQPYFIGGSTITIGCSIGIAIAPDHARDAETLVRNSDLALYAAKAGGRGNHRFFQEELLTQARSRKAMEDDLRVALERGEFSLVYQPVVSTATAQVVGYEACCAGTTRAAGSRRPNSSRSRRIRALSIRSASGSCARLRGLPRPGRFPARVAVNVSPIQFLKAALPAIVTGALAQSGIDPDRLELEITEGVFLNEDSSTLRMIAALKQTGLRLVLDDFGTGYSSLAYLKRAPFDKVKIDQSFVRGAAHDTQNRAIIRAVVAMADTLGWRRPPKGWRRRTRSR